MYTHNYKIYQNICVYIYIYIDTEHHIFLVVWNMFFFNSVRNNHPNLLSYFSEGVKPPIRTIIGSTD